MVSNVRILGARRAYEFKQDELRISYVAQSSVMDKIARAFKFQIQNVAAPAPTFGPVPPTLPPGVVFDYGSCELDNGIRVPIRFIHFEVRRIVIDVAGPSETIASVYAQLRTVLGDDVMPDGAPVLPEHASVRDYSELTVQLPPGVEQLLNPGLVKLAQKVLRAEGLGRGELLVPVLQFRIQQTEQEFPRNIETARMLRIEPRAGALPADNDYFSSAPLSSEAHAEALGHLAELIRS